MITVQKGDRVKTAGGQLATASSDSFFDHMARQIVEVKTDDGETLKCPVITLEAVLAEQVIAPGHYVTYEGTANPLIKNGDLGVVLSESETHKGYFNCLFNGVEILCRKDQLKLATPDALGGSKDKEDAPTPEIKHDLPTTESLISVATMSVRYIQDADSNSEERDLQSLEIETSDAGEGVYYVLKTDRWAFDNVEELVKVLTDFQNRVK